MSSTDPQKSPGSGAGDPAPTQKIPRLDGKGTQGSDTTSSAPSKARSEAKTPAKPRPATGASPASRSTAGKGTTSSSAAPSAGGTSAPAKKVAGTNQGAGASGPGSSSAATSKSPAGKEPAGRDRTSGPTKKTASTSGSGGSTGRSSSASKPSESPMTARDYARTTRESSDTTAVIPPVRDSSPSRPSSAPTSATSAVRDATNGRRANLRLVHVEPWSVTRLAFVVSVALMLVAVVGVSIFWLVLDLSGVWDSLNGSIVNVLSDGAGTFDLTDYLGLGRLVGLTLLLSAINVIVMTMMATIAAHLYNLSAQLLGGISVTFSDN